MMESDKSVKSLLEACTHDYRNGGEYFFKMNATRKAKCKEVGSTTHQAVFVLCTSWA